MADEQGAIPEALERLQDAANRELGFRRGIIKNDRVVVTRADLQWLLDRFPDCDPDAPAADRLTDTGKGPAGDCINAPDRIWLCGFGTDHGDISWSSCPDPTEDPDVDGEQVEYVRALATPKPPVDAGAVREAATAVFIGAADYERALTIVQLEVDQLVLFDMVAATGDGGAAVGMRLAGLLLGDDSLSTALGLACYGITRAALHDAAHLQHNGEGVGS